MSKIKEACGVFGIYLDEKDKNDINVAEEAYLALYALQHRGQESCGIAVAIDEDNINYYKDTGLVPDVFNPMVMNHLQGGHIAIGHTRYGVQTDKGSSRDKAQPLISKYKRGSVSLAFNGALTNSDSLRSSLQNAGAIFQTYDDSEIMLYILAKERLSCHSLEDAVLRMMDKLKGAYSLVIMSGHKLIAARDPVGFRPLCMGKLNNSIVFASESCAFDSIGAEFIRDIAPGEVVVVSESGIEHHKKDNCGKTGACIFEYIYFARPDSIIDGASVHEARKQAGRFLAEEHPVEADVVCGVPDSGLDAALGYSEYSGIPYGLAFIKNRYIGRTFIQPTQGQRERAVQIKLNPLRASVKGKRVVLTDDSIVRGTTLMNTIRLLKNAGAKEVHLRISSPPFTNPCYFGTDISSKENLIACRMSVDEICRHIGADSLGYLSIENVKKIAVGANLDFCYGCFSGKYPIEIEE